MMEMPSNAFQCLPMAKNHHLDIFLLFEGGCRTTVMIPGQPTQSANCPDDNKCVSSQV